MSQKIITGIDTGDYAIKIIVAEIRDKARLPRPLAVIKKPSYGFRRGVIIDPEEAQKSIAEALQAAEKISQQKIKKVYLAAGGMSTTSEIIETTATITRIDSDITDEDINHAVEAAREKIEGKKNKEILLEQPLSYRLDGKKIIGSPRGLKGTKLEMRILFVTCFNHHYEELFDAVERCGVTIETIISSPIAASTATLSKTQKMAGGLLVDIGADITHMAVFEEGIPHLIEVCELGSQDITNDIALGLKISIEEAEEIKTGTASHVFAQKKLNDIIEARLIDIFEVINKNLKKIDKSELLPAGIAIVGGGAFIPHIESVASRSLNLPARIGSPLYPQHLSIPEEQHKELSRVLLKDPSFAVAYGLIAYAQNPPSSSMGNPIHGTHFPPFKKLGANLNRLIRHFLP